MAVVQASIPDLGNGDKPSVSRVKFGVIRVASLDAICLSRKEPAHSQVQSEPAHAEQVAPSHHNVEFAPQVPALLRGILVYFSRQCRSAKCVCHLVQAVTMIDELDANVRYR